MPPDPPSLACCVCLTHTVTVEYHMKADNLKITLNQLKVKSSVHDNDLVHGWPDHLKSLGSGPGHVGVCTWLYMTRF